MTKLYEGLAISLDLFQITVSFYITEHPEELLRKEFPHVDSWGTETDGMVFWSKEENTGGVCIVFKQPLCLEIIMHECIHAANQIIESRHLICENDELHAYLASYLFKEFLQFFKIKTEISKLPAKKRK